MRQTGEVAKNDGMALDTYLCPTCGTEAKVGGPCPGCAPKRRRKRKKVGAAAKKPWEADSLHDGLDFPDEDFDYDEFVEKEFGRPAHKRIGIKWYWWVTGLVLVIALAWMMLGGGW